MNSDKRRVQCSVDAYLRELELQILSDGGHYELSPMYHANVLQDAMVVGTLLGTGNAAADRLHESIVPAQHWLDAMRMTPESWANVNDSWTIPSLARTVWDGRPWTPTSGINHLKHSGYVRGGNRRWEWLLDVGSVGPAFNPRHSHSDSMSVLLSYDGIPLIVDPGVLHYSPNDERRFLKSCHSHNGPCLRDRDHTEMIGSFRVGRAGRARMEKSSVEAHFHAVTASLDGYDEVSVVREINSWPNRFEIVDTWSPRGNRSFAPWSRFLWNADIANVDQCSVGADAISLRFHCSQNRLILHLHVQILGCSNPRLAIHESWYSDRILKTLLVFETIATGESATDTVQLRTVATLL